VAKTAIELYSRKDVTNRCIHILSGRVPPKLNVKIAGRQVTAASLTSVAEAIQQQRIKVGLFDPNNPKIDEKGYGLVPKGFGAMRQGQMASYMIGGNELWLTKPPTKPYYEAMVAHEATHAYFDMRHWDCSTRIAEAAAHIVEGWYLWRFGYKARKGSRERLMIRAAIVLATITDPVRRNKYKKKYPKDWKQRLKKRLKKAYKALTSDLGEEDYALDEPVDFDGI